MRAGRRFATSAVALLIGSAALGWCGSARAAKTLYSVPQFRLGPELTADRAGNLYDTTALGAVFRLVHPTAPGQRWTRQTLYTFPRSCSSVAPGMGGQLALDDAGDIYGTCVGGGSAGAGTAWRLRPPSAPGGAWTLAVLHTFTGTFTGSLDGRVPGSGLVMDHSGTLYGTTEYGGTANRGTVFSLTPPPPGGTTWTETVLHAFGGHDARPAGDPLVLSSHDTALTGVIAATTSRHDTSSVPAVFQLRRRSSTWTYHAIHRFAHGTGPSGPLVVDGNGNIFGTTRFGGTDGSGSAFELSPPAPGQASWTERDIYDFIRTTSSEPLVGLVAGGSPPALFGTAPFSNGTAVDGSTGADGVVFRLDPPASGSGLWTYTALHAFDVGPNRTAEPGPLTFGVHRFLFGVTVGGGKYGNGFIYQVSPHIPAAPAGAVP